MKSLLSIGEAARRLGLSVDTVRDLERSGELRAVRTPGGHRRFDPAELDAYLAGRPTPNLGRQRARAPTPRAPTQHAARRRRRAAALDDEPPEGLPDDAWDDPESFEPPPPRPVPPAPKSPHEHPLFAQVQRLLEPPPARPAVDPGPARIASLKKFGLDQIPWGVPDSEKGKVVQALERYVTPALLPLWVSDADARALVRARVEEVLKPYHAGVARREQDERDERRVQALINAGMSHARWETTDWDSEDRDVARREVERQLKDVVEPDWTDDDVKDEVNAVLDDWEEDDPEEE